MIDLLVQQKWAMIEGNYVVIVMVLSWTRNPENDDDDGDDDIPNAP